MTWGQIANDEQASFALWQSVYGIDDVPTSEALTVEALVYGVDAYAVATIPPILHDRLFPMQWMPGINLEHEQARGLVATFPMWDRSGIAHDLIGHQNFALDVHSWQKDRYLGDVLHLDQDHVTSYGGSPQLLKESDGFAISVWLKRDTSGIVLGRLDSTDPSLFRWYLTFSGDSISLKIDDITLAVAVVTDTGWHHLASQDHHGYLLR